MNDDVAPRRCGLYLPGHEVHWIQGLRSGNDLETPLIEARLVSVDGDGAIALEVEGRAERFWNHEPDRLSLLTARGDNRVTLQPRWGVLRVPSPRGAYLFCVGAPDDHRQCPPAPPCGDPIELERDTAVDGALTRTGRCLLIDGHSFPSVPLPYELDQAPERPDICLGTDAFHTPRELLDSGIAEVERLGWTVAVDRPFSGTIVPMAHYRRDARVASLMVEVNRRLYMDETSGVPTPAFDDVRERLHDLVRRVAAAVLP